MKTVIAAILFTISSIASAESISVACTGTETTTYSIGKKPIKEVSKVAMGFIVNTHDLSAVEQYNNLTQNVTWVTGYHFKNTETRDFIAVDKTTFIMSRTWPDRKDNMYHKIFIDRVSGAFSVKTDTNDGYLRNIAGTCQKQILKF